MTDLPYQNNVLNLLKQASYTPSTLEGIAVALGLEKKDVKKLKKTIYNLLDSGSIVRVKQDRFILPRDVNLITGVVQFKNNGSALIFQEGQIAGPPPYLVRQEDTHLALPGDLVVARVIQPNPRPLYYKGYKAAPPQGELYARILRIIKRNQDAIIGTLKKGNLYYYIIPDDPRFPKDIIVDNPENTGLYPLPKTGDKVSVQLLEWEHRNMNPTGKIIDTFGPSHTPRAEFQAILKKYKLSPTFPEAVLKEVSALPNKVRDQDLKNRMDCTSLFTLTIDPDDAKDFDDALSLNILDNSDIEIGVHIADVGAYVTPNSALDKEAHSRGNSTYLVGTVIPMLPHELSNGLCSLVEQEIRLTKSVFLTYSNTFQLKKTAFANSFIRSQKRLTYKQAYAFLNIEKIQDLKNIPSPPSHQTGSTGRPLKNLSDAELLKIQSTIRTFWAIAKKMREARIRKGSLDLDIPEVKIFVDPEGYPNHIEHIQNDESHQLIEEFMLAANETVAKVLHEANFPYISRVHDKPDPEKLEELSDVLISHNLSIGDLSQRPQVTKLLSVLKEHPQGHTLKVQFLRSLKQACYRAQADGHYGLNKIHYAHFTSPIRRYADLILHRVFDEYLIKTQHPTSLKKPKVNYTKGQQESFAQHISITEKNSTQAERESVKIKLLEYFDIQSKQTPKVALEAIITDLRNYGFFVELKLSMAYGLVHISGLKDDIYTLCSAGTYMEGRRYKRRYSLGQTVWVTIDKVDRYKRQLDFQIAENNSSSSKNTNPPHPPLPYKSKNNRKFSSKKLKPKRA